MFYKASLADKNMDRIGSPELRRRASIASFPDSDNADPAIPSSNYVKYCMSVGYICSQNR